METLIVIVVLASLGTGFAAGWGSKPNRTHKLIEAQGESIKQINESQAGILTVINKGHAELLENATKPIVMDAELRAALASIPVQCVESAGGNPASVQCQWATCLQFGQSAAQRPECRKVEDLMIATLKQENCDQ